MKKYWVEIALLTLMFVGIAEAGYVHELRLTINRYAEECGDRADAPGGGR